MNLDGVGLNELGCFFDDVGGNIVQTFALLQPQVDVSRWKLVNVEPVAGVKRKIWSIGFSYFFFVVIMARSNFVLALTI